MGIRSWFAQSFVPLRYRSPASMKEEDRLLRSKYVICVRGIRRIKGSLQQQRVEIDAIPAEESTPSWQRLHRVQDEVATLRWRGDILLGQRKFCLARRAVLKEELARRGAVH
jgi:hypothetical protein